jgi:hypothetical protein
MWALHRALDYVPDATAPYEWMISRFCEEFNCRPSEAIDELENDPNRLAETIMVLRSYSTIKDLVDKRIAGQQVSVPDTPLLKIVLKNVERRVMERK